MWQKFILLILLMVWLGGCLEAFTRASHKPLSSFYQGETNANDDVPTPQLFGYSLNLSEP